MANTISIVNQVAIQLLYYEIDFSLLSIRLIFEHFLHESDHFLWVKH